jgi:hypothetical protein
MRPRHRGILACILAAAAGIIAPAQAYLVRQAPDLASESRLLYLPNGRFLRVASLGYPTFLADLIYLWSIQHYGSVKGEERFAYLEHVYGEVIARLDPRYVDPYLIGSMILVVEKGDLEAGLELLDKGFAANPTEWILPYEAGFWAYDHGKDYERAARYFAQAMALPGSPRTTPRLHAEMFNKKGDKFTSLALWTDVLASATDEKVRAIATNHVHDLTIETDILNLRKAVAGYEAARGRRPPRLEALVEDGHLRALPIDPDGHPYLYDPATGEIKAQASFILRRHS